MLRNISRNLYNRIAYSQPTDLRVNNFHQSQMMDYSSGPHVLSFSQPSHRDFGPMNTDDGFPTSYLGSPTSSFMDVFPSERITRFYSPYDPEHIFQRICVTFDQFLVQYRENQSLHTIWFSTVDKRKCPMQGEACIQIVGGENLCLVTFRKSRVNEPD
jgi:serine/threonine-protein kinase Chk1